LFTVAQIAERINGRVAGNAQHQISAPAKIEDAADNQVSFLANEKYLPYLHTTLAGCIIISASIYEKVSSGVKHNFIVVDDAYSAFTTLLQIYQQLKHTDDKQPYTIGKDTVIYPNVYIGANVVIGDHCIVYPNVSIYRDCVIGNNCIIHSGAVIGADGFGFAPQPDGGYQKIPQLGNVVIEDDCEIGANTCIDRATMGSTILRKGVKLDNLIQVAHNVEIGAHTVIAAQTGISGSTKIGHHNMIGGQVGFVGHLAIAPYTKINAKSAVASDVKTPNQILSGIPAIDMKQHFKATVVYKQLPELDKKLRQLQLDFNQLKENL
jgi:UDP-3-O-[3-hydroxymyristoyl] glucosamine N-acyltransferase